MEAPEKIYIPTAGDELHYHMTCPNNDFKESIEYTRTNALIEKAWDWLKEEYPKAAAYYEQPDSFIDQFRKAMKGD